MTIIKTFWIEPTDKVACSLRRYHQSDIKCAVSKTGYHNAHAPIETVIVPAKSVIDLCDQTPPRDDPRWPKTCACGYVFLDTDQWQLFPERIYRRIDNGAECKLRDAPPGALYNAAWLAERDDNFMKGYDGLSIHCVKPHGDVWCIDARASNCTLKDDDVHRCWVRHGTFGETVHVDKAGNTCGAGAGSIYSGKNNEWHGFLDHGFLTPQRGVYA